VSDPMARPSYTDSVAVLKERVAILGDALLLVDRCPRHDDGVVGPSIFRMLVEDVSLAGLTLPGLYVGRAELRGVVFRDADLHLSAFNWSDIVECDFTGADLSDADLRACGFVRCSFRGANLAGADLRASSFEGCSFEGANAVGARLHRRSKAFGFIPTGADQQSLPLTAEQRSVVQWCRDAPEPGGG
jgi:BTB/POZ domain-containing protein KCTD9